MTKSPMPPEVDRAWAAGFFDGEGCFSLASRGNRAVATISQTHREVLDRFQSIVKRGRVYGPQSGGTNVNRQPFYVWRVGARADFDYVVEVLAPYLGSVKRSAADRVAASASPGGNAQSRKTHCPQGHAYDAVNTLFVKGGRGRMCRTCHNARSTVTNSRRPRRGVAPMTTARDANPICEGSGLPPARTAHGWDLCPECGRRYRVTSTGRLRLHRLRNYAKPRPKHCTMEALARGPQTLIELQRIHPPTP